MAHVEFDFENNKVQVLAAFDDAISQFLLEASAEMVSQIARRTPVDEGQLKGSWKANVNESKQEAIIGSELEYAIYQEFGTGEHALKGNGRKGGWIYVDKNGERHFTFGNKPARMMHNAFTATMPKIIRRAEQIFKERMN